MSTILLNIGIIGIYYFIISNLNLSRNKQSKLFLYFCFFHLLFLYIFKDTTEFPDIQEYGEYYNSLSTSFRDFSTERDGDRIELGWYIVNKIFRNFFAYNSFCIICFAAILTLISYITVIKRHSTHVFLSIFIFICLNFYPSLFVLRQHLAIPICLLSINSIINRNLKQFILITLVAISFHYSAIIWLPTYFLYRYKLSTKMIINFVLCFVIFTALLDTVLNHLTLILPIIASYRADAFDGMAAAGGAYKPFLTDLFLLSIVIYAHGGIKKINGVNYFCTLMLFITLLFDTLHYTGSSFALFSRLLLYFQSCAIIIIPNSIGLIKNKFIRFCIIAMIIILYIKLLGAFVNYGFQIKL